MTTTVGVRTAAPRVRDVLAVGRPAFWVVSIVPYYVGILLATRRLVPPLEDWPRLIVGAVVMGPLVWLAVLAINDAYDLPSDRLNPRKSKSPLLDGRITLRAVKRIAFAAAVAAVGISLHVGIVFALGVLLAVLLGYAYSVPPVRLKTRAGFDVAVNALALGAFGPLAGWAAVNPDLSDFPWLMGLQGTLAAVGLYLPTTLADLGADRVPHDRGPVRCADDVPDRVRRLDRGGGAVGAAGRDRHDHPAQHARARGGDGAGADRGVPEADRAGADVQGRDRAGLAVPLSVRHLRADLYRDALDLTVLLH
ncbi:UbiA prenyltransferase family protein [Kribbella sp. NPDC023972]|uniref:UbiA prenyltransferase family protein n=1 Tax=Kribbella sp. NPDC023972 TaxID=3154795 RepID=UPI00341089E0